jgi:nucleotide-binding universal stress UspA family protein
MKLLICTDGSEQSQKALEKALVIATADFIEEVAILHVYEGKMDTAAVSWGSRDYTLTEEDVQRFKEIYEKDKEKRKQILDDAQQMFKEKNIATKAILKEGHPSHTIAEVAEENGYDLIILGSRGYGGLKKILLGSVSNAVVQEVKNSSVLIVK